MSKQLRKDPAAKGSKGKGVPYTTTATRRERSRDLAQQRRTNYKAIMDDLTQVRGT